jgi:AcrR family transcriptional regulator
MARTINAPVHAVRRDAFVDAAQRLIQAKGYEQMSIQDVLDELSASRGAFYHYFDSKQALLESVISRMVDGALGSVEPVLADPQACAPEKVAGLFSGIASWKNQRKDLLLGVLRVWLSDDNAIVREQFRREAIQRLTPVLAPVIAQGAAEGTFHVSSPDATARVFISLMLGANEAATQLFIARQAGEIGLEEVEPILAAYADGMERILGGTPGSIQLVDPSTIRLWFG